MLQQEELFPTDLRFINGIPCAEMPLDCDVVGIAVDQSISFLLLFLSLVLRHDLPLERSHIDVQYDFSPAPVPSSLYSLVKLYHLLSLIHI